MIPASELLAWIRSSWRTADEHFKRQEPADWTCYSAGEPTPEWVLQAAGVGSTPTDILAMLAESCNLKVRMAVADNQSASLDTRMMLAQDESADLRYQLAENHNIEESVLKVLADDLNPYVARRAQTTLRRVQGGAAILSFPLLAMAPSFAPDFAEEPVRQLKRMKF